MAWKIRDHGGSELTPWKLRTNFSMDKKPQPQNTSLIDCKDYIPFFVVLINRDLLAGNQSRQGIGTYLANPFGGKLPECLNKPGRGFYKLSHFVKGVQPYP